jgi:hypothetical protein
MSMPGFTAVLSLSRSTRNYRARVSGISLAISRSATPQAIGGFGGFGPTLPTCHWEKRWVECGSPLPGYPTPMCYDWVYVCKFPGSSREALM